MKNLFLSLSLLFLAHCLQGENERCQVDSDCQDGLQCNAGIELCQRPGAQTDSDVEVDDTPRDPAPELPEEDEGDEGEEEADEEEADEEEAGEEEAGEEEAGEEEAGEEEAGEEEAGEEEIAMPEVEEETGDNIPFQGGFQTGGRDEDGTEGGRRGDDLESRWSTRLRELFAPHSR